MIKILSVGIKNFKKYSTRKSLNFEERALSIIGSFQQLQLSSYSEEKEKNVFSSLVPYIIFDKNVSTLYDIPSTKLLKDYELFFCTLKSSTHANNLQEREYLPNLMSITIGTSDYMTNLFENSGRFPPRTVLSGYTDSIDEKSKLFEAIWNQGFKEHTHINKDLKPENINLYRMSKVVTGYYVDYGGNMNMLNNLQLSQSKMDPLAKVQMKIIQKYNSNRDELNDLVEKGFNVDEGEKFLFHIDRYSMRLLGRPKGSSSSDTWSEYFCEFGEELSSEEKLKDYLLKFHQVV